MMDTMTNTMTAAEQRVWSGTQVRAPKTYNVIPVSVHTKDIQQVLREAEGRSVTVVWDMEVSPGVRHATYTWQSGPGMFVRVA